MPDAPGLELIAAEIDGEHPGAVLGTSFEYGQAALAIDPEQVRGVLTWLREQSAHRYDFLSSVHGADYLPAEPRFAVHYELLNRERVERIRVKALLADPAAGVAAADSARGAAAAGSAGGGAPAGDEPVLHAGAAEDPLPEIDSVTDLFPTANFQEREIYDFFGIVFRGHPNLTRILMPEGYAGWPQRRDYPVGGEPVIFTRDEPTSPGWWR